MKGATVEETSKYAAKGTYGWDGAEATNNRGADVGEEKDDDRIAAKEAADLEVKKVVSEEDKGGAPEVEGVTQLWAVPSDGYEEAESFDTPMVSVHLGPPQLVVRVEGLSEDLRY